MRFVDGYAKRNVVSLRLSAACIGDVDFRMDGGTIQCGEVHPLQINEFLKGSSELSGAETVFLHQLKVTQTGPDILNEFSNPYSFFSCHGTVPRLWQFVPQEVALDQSGDRREKGHGVLYREYIDEILRPSLVPSIP